MTVQPRQIVNALCVDLDDLSHALLEQGKRIKNPVWTVTEETFRLLEHLDLLGLKATFFVPGHTARYNPSLIKTIVEDGHEIASHGELHCAVKRLGQTGFLSDAITSRKRLEDMIGRAVVTYKAPIWSLTPDCPWAYDVLAEAGYLFDHSATPNMKRALGHDPLAQKPFRTSSGVIVIPPTSISIAGRPTMFPGGFYTAYVPQRIHKKILEKLNNEEIPFNFYFHPFEHSPAQIHRDRLFKDTLSTTLYTLHLGRHRKRLEELSRSFALGTLEEAYAGYVGKI